MALNRPHGMIAGMARVMAIVKCMNMIGHRWAIRIMALVLLGAGCTAPSTDSKEEPKEVPPAYAPDARSDTSEVSV